MLREDSDRKKFKDLMYSNPDFMKDIQDFVKKYELNGITVLITKWVKGEKDEGGFLIGSVAHPSVKIDEGIDLKTFVDNCPHLVLHEAMKKVVGDIYNAKGGGSGGFKLLNNGGFQSFKNINGE
ncbi:MAG: hypothetical protein GF317_04685 [Candidatus Lokiarchaeota archaeon]|nr:hypothetical protein [Candidatus Lokiarchaeota archaeon]